MTLIYMSLLWSELAYISIYYVLGYLALYTKSITLLQWFASFSLFGLIFEMVLAYINRFDIFIFIMRFIGFLYSRFLSQLLVSLLLLPRAWDFVRNNLSFFIFNFKLWSWNHIMHIPSRINYSKGILKINIII